MLKKELIRHHFWHTPIDIRAVNHARRKGRLGIRSAAESRLHRSIGSARPHRDGYQTPKNGNTIYYAQHATATCCRKCLEYWHGIPQGRPLTDDEVSYLTELICLYIDDRLPQLTEKGERIAYLRKGA
jgi:hypothetical protein